jgi:hypothetical protein
VTSPDGPGPAGLPTVSRTTVPSGPDPCTVLTAAEVELLIGPPDEPPKGYTDGRQCIYRSHPGGELAQLDFSYDPRPGRYDEFVKGAKATPVAGVGQQAAETTMLEKYLLTATNGRYFVQLGYFVRATKKLDKAAMGTVVNRVLTALK